MTHFSKPAVAATALLALVACGDDGKSQKTDETPTAQESGTMDAARDMATQATEALKLDTSSDADKQKLTSALATLAKDVGGDSKSGLMDAAKGMASGKSMTETLYEKLGDRLDGKTFDDILNMAG